MMTQIFENFEQVSPIHIPNFAFYMGSFIPGDWFYSSCKAFCTKSVDKMISRVWLNNLMPLQYKMYRSCKTFTNVTTRTTFYTNWVWNNYRLITAYLLLRVNLDKIMHARWDFDASSARTRRVSALDKHQNWSASALFCLNSRAQNKYTGVNLIHTRRKQTVLSFIMW